MNEIAMATYNDHEFIEIMEMLEKRLNDKGKHWRHVLKALTVLDFSVHAGSENVVNYARDNLYIIKTLQEFQYRDETGIDHGTAVRHKAKDLFMLLSDVSRIQEQRRKARGMAARLNMHTGAMVVSKDRGRTNSLSSQSSTRSRSRPGLEEEEQIRRAIEESKKTAKIEAARRRPTKAITY